MQYDSKGYSEGAQEESDLDANEVAVMETLACLDICLRCRFGGPMANFHTTLVNLVESIRLAGPIWSWWAFGDERINGDTMRQVKPRQNLEKNVMKRVHVQLTWLSMLSTLTAPHVAYDYVHVMYRMKAQSRINACRFFPSVQTRVRQAMTLY